MTTLRPAHRRRLVGPNRQLAPPESRPPRPPPRELLADRAAIDAAAHSADTVPVDSLALLSPVTTPCRVVAQMTNYASHVKDAGMDPKSIPLTFFRKASGSISGPFDDIVKPGARPIPRLRGRDRPRHRPRHPRRHHGHRSEPARLHRRASSSPTTCPRATSSCPRPSSTRPSRTRRSRPVGPALVLLDADELKRFGDLRLQLRVNGELRQNMVVERRHDLPAAAGAAGADPVPATSTPAIWC